MIDIDKAIVFAEREGFRALELDVYRGADTQPACSRWSPSSTAGMAGRVIAAVRPGRRASGNRFFERFVDAGFVVVALDYRLSGEALFPAQIDDVVEALRWLRRACRRAGASRPERVYLWGASGGGLWPRWPHSCADAPPVAGVRCAGTR